MQFVILDVGHGFCAYAEADNGGLCVFDCGHKTNPEVRPSVVLPRPRAGWGKPHIGRFFITNFDEDHISDLPRLRETYYIEVLHRNKSISPDRLRTLKLEGGPISPAMEACLQMMGEYTGGVSNPPDLPGLSWIVYWNNYGESFTDTNNISLVTFLNVGGMTVLIPGDLERPGWLRLLERASFQTDLRRVSIFIASHHGRENGYCREVFDYCSPHIVVFSDSRIQYATQEMTNTYAQHASGMSFDGQRRYVVTTRNDGTISFWPTQ